MAGHPLDGPLPLREPVDAPEAHADLRMILESEQAGRDGAVPAAPAARLRRNRRSALLTNGRGWRPGTASTAVAPVTGQGLHRSETTIRLDGSGLGVVNPPPRGCSLLGVRCCVVGHEFVRRRGRRSRSRSAGSAGHASWIASCGTRRAANRNASATTITSSSGPITGKNSGIRSIGDRTHTPATATASFAAEACADPFEDAESWSSTPAGSTPGPSPSQAAVASRARS